MSSRQLIPHRDSVSARYEPDLLNGILEVPFRLIRNGSRKIISVLQTECVRFGGRLA